MKPGPQSERSRDRRTLDWHDIDRMARDLHALIEGEVRFTRHERMLYATDASIYQAEPIGVVCPRHAADVENVVRYCAEHGLPILPRGGGSSLAGQTVNHALVIDFSVHCKALLEVDAARKIVRIQPGIVLDHLNAALAKHGLMFGPDVASSWNANLGGMIGNNSAGAQSIVYGRTVEHLRGLNVLLADGSRLTLDQGAAIRDPHVREITQQIADIILPLAAEIDQRFPKTIRHVDGYNLDLILKQLRASRPGEFDQVNLAHLVCGSEGTLALTLEAELNLVPIPKRTGLAIVGFANVDEALRSLTTVLDTQPSAVELIDDVVIGVALRNVEYRRYVDLLPKAADGTPGAVLYVGYFAEDDDQLRAKFDELQSHFPRHTINRYARAAEMANAWKLRKAGEPLLHGISGSRKPITFIEDLAVDPQKLADFVAEFRQMVTRYGTTAAYYAHASVGCLHIRPLVNPRDLKDINIMREMAVEATELVKRYGGALSGEHGDGRLRSHLLEQYFGKPICDAFRAIKEIFDPQHRLNPGNIVDVQANAMTDHLRVKPREKIIAVPDVKTFYRYEKEHGFGEAVEMCNGAGVCRKTRGGTMCPSYRATLDERHATRGRGNALRLAITGQLGDGESPRWNDADTLNTLDLCLSCKACKSECPSNVDVAKLKAEYLAQTYASGARVPLAIRAFANVRMLNRIGSALHPVANAMARFGPLKSISQRMLSIHPKRDLPRFEPSLYRSARKRVQTPFPGKKASDPVSSPAVVLLPDCFTVYNESRIGNAAIEVLEALGYRVVLPKLGCCGRSMISTGMLRDAQRVCANTARALIDCVRKKNAIAIVGCEPSCISAIKDDWLDLDMDVDRDALRALADRTAMIEQFIESRWDQHPQRPGLSSSTLSSSKSGPPVLLHGHCHQKALWGIESSAAILRRLLGDRLHVIDSGCCGMAGAFGYTRDHYHISMKIGEQSLFNPIRQSPDAIVIAPGTSCRQQIHDGIARTALHPIELIAELMMMDRELTTNKHE